MIDTETKPKPIQMSAWSVSRILDGAKTETRRKVPDHLQVADNVVQTGPTTAFVRGPANQEEVDLIEEVTLHEPGDRLYVREPVYRGEDGIARYEADEEKVQVHREPDGPRVQEIPVWNAPDDAWLIDADWLQKWSRDRQPSMFMPKAWSRILLEVTEVDAHRLQEIEPEEAYAEGIAPMGRRAADGLVHEVNPVEGFIKLWNDLHGDGAWESNPWVWRIAFTVIHPEV